jgi:transposase-like protein
MKNTEGSNATCTKHYSNRFKEKICQEYLKTGVSLCYLSDKYQIAGHHTIKGWLRTFGDDRMKKEPQGKMIMAKPKKEDLPMTMEQMKKRIRELERQLEDAELKVELNEKIIEIAEEQLNIQIRKKSDTK